MPSTYDKEKMLFSDVLEEFVSTTQPKAWARYTKLYGASAVDKLTRRVNTAISESNVLDVLKRESRIWVLKSNYVISSHHLI